MCTENDTSKGIVLRFARPTLYLPFLVRIGDIGHVDVPGSAGVDPVDDLALAIRGHLEAPGTRINA